MRRFTVVALLVVALVAAASPLASTAPDGLNRVAERQGFAARGHARGVQERAPAGGYALPGVHDPRLAKALAGLAGCAIVFVLGAAVARRRPAGARAA
jgi:hypothetical protein